MRKIIIIFLAIWGVAGLRGIRAQEEDVPFAVEERMEAVVEKIMEEKEVEVMGIRQIYQEVQLLVTSGSEEGERITIINGDIPLADSKVFRLKDRVIVSKQRGLEGEAIYNVVDYLRTESMTYLFLLFIGLTLIVTRWKGVASLVSMALTFGVVVGIMLPKISEGSNPVAVAILGAGLIIPITFYLSHGINRKTTVAIGSTLISLLITGSLSIWFMNWGKLSGISSEEAALLFSMKPGILSMRGLLLAGIVIGSLGILDDITVAQAAVVEQLKLNSEKIKFGQLYQAAMKVGRDHIASMVNTLVLVYAGASLPLMLLFVDSTRPFREIINYEFMAEEVVRTLAGSIGLILAVPITTLMAAWAFKHTEATRRAE